MEIHDIQVLVHEMLPKRKIIRSINDSDYDLFEIKIVEKNDIKYVNIQNDTGPGRYGSITKFNINIPEGSSIEYINIVLNGIISYYNECEDKSRILEYNKSLMFNTL